VSGHVLARIVAAATLVAAGLCLSAAAPVKDPVQDLVKKVETRYRKLNDFSADFTQTTSVRGFASAIKSAGRVYLKRPGKLRWDYLEPTLEQIFVEDDKVQFYIPEHKQVLTGQLSKMTNSQAPLQLLQGVGRLDTYYLVSRAPDGAKGSGGLPILHLTLRDGGPDHPRIVVEVDAATHFLRRIELHDVNGNVSTFVFSSFKPNTGLKEEVFAFTAPQDVEVIHAPTLSPP